MLAIARSVPLPGWRPPRAQMITARRGEAGVQAFRALLEKMQAKIELVDAAQAELAYAA